MATVEVKSVAGAVVGNADLPDAVFGVQPNVPVMHQVVTAQLAAARAGTHKVKGRSEVAGGGSKPWRQKGTGRARQGSTRAPHWRGGGVAHGPVLRDYRQRTPKKMVRLALLSALSDRAASGNVLVVDTWGWTEPKTKDARAALAALGVGQGKERVLIVLGPNDEVPWKSFRNLGDRVHLLMVGELNAYDVLVSDHVVFTRETLDWSVARFRAADGVDTVAPQVPASTPPAAQVAAAEDAAGIVDPQAAAVAQVEDTAPVEDTAQVEDSAAEDEGSAS